MFAAEAPFIQLPPPVQELPAQSGNITLQVLRLDRLHAVISGNKWYKLKYHLAAAKAGNYSCITSFGGPYSNHLVALACAGRLSGLRTKGFIRGEPGSTETHTLLQAKAFGMELQFLSRTAFAELRKQHFVLQTAPEEYLVPEGGGGETGVRGAAEIMQADFGGTFTHVVCAMGTGATAAGIYKSLTPAQQLIAINALKGGSFQLSEILQWSGKDGRNLECCNDFHFGGFARHKPELFQFMNEWFTQTGIPTDFVYTGKLFFALNRMLAENKFPPGSRVLAIHSGGLQGNESLPKGTLIF